MDQTKELRNLYIKGLMVGNKCKIQLTQSVGARNEEGAYVKYAEKGDVVDATIVKEADGVVHFKIVAGAGHVLVPLTEGKIR